MAEDWRGAGSGAGLAALIGDAGGEATVVDRRAASAGCRSPSSGRTRAIRARASTTATSTTSPLRSARRAWSSRSWSARRRRSATSTRSSPASGAGGRRSGPACTTCRSSSTTSSDREALELAIIENVQRADLNALEEALGYQQLIDEHGYSQGQLAEVIGKSRPHIANTLRLLKLPEPVQAYVRERPAHRRPCARAGDARRSRGGGAAHRRGRA